MTTTTSTSPPSSSDDARRAPRRLSIEQRSGIVHVACSTRDDGDFHLGAVPFGELEARRRRFVDLPWTMLDEHHGVGVVTVEEPGGRDGEPGDVAVTRSPDAVLGCWVGDCAPIVLVGLDRAVATVHAGWRGLAAGIVDVAVAALGEPPLAAVLGPVIGPCCYEFGDAELRLVAAGVGAAPAAVAGRTSHGTAALDVPAAVAAALARHDVRTARVGGCTGCSDPTFSHRVRRERSRHVVAAWREGAAA